MKTVQLSEVIGLNELITLPILEDYLYNSEWKDVRTDNTVVERIGWNKIAEVPRIITGTELCEHIEIIASNDFNIPSIAHCYLSINTYSTDKAYSVCLSSSPIIRNKIHVCLDNEGGIWLSSSNQWLNIFKFRPIFIYSKKDTILNKPVLSNSKPDNTSNIVTNNGGIRYSYNSNDFTYYNIS